MTSKVEQTTPSPADKTTNAARKPRKKWILRCVLLTVSFAIATPIVCDRWVARAGSRHRPPDISSVPAHDVALVLGTARTINGRPNAFFTYRIEAAAALLRPARYADYW